MSENKTQWENVYNDKGDFQKMEYPSDIIVTFVRRSRFNKIAPKDRNQIRCCDLGCGWGNNLEFLKKESFDCYGVDFWSYAAILSRCRFLILILISA